jgi:hypothetical protein
MTHATAETNMYDLVVVGGGIFGIYTALTKSRAGQRVALIERETALWTKASAVNQARVHTGYHYPRSLKTARMAFDHRDRFLREHRFAIDDTYECLYALDRSGSLTDAVQFERFCNKLGIPARRVWRPDILVEGRLEAVYHTEEFTFDPLLLRDYYLRELAGSDVDLMLQTAIVSADTTGTLWEIDVRNQGEGGTVKTLSTPAVVNATYANINSLNTIFGFDPIPATHEISELLLVHSDKLRDIGLTVMDGPYISIMPFGKTGLHSLSSVLYTHVAFSGQDKPEFACQNLRADCTTEFVRDCTTCFARPRSNAQKMLAQAKLYLRDADLYPHGSIYTVKTKLKSAMMDDGRPTDIRVFARAPYYACLFSGKVNSIYEVDEIQYET